MTMKATEGQMTFWDHLDALRAVIFKCLGLVALFSVLFFAYMRPIMDSVVLAPARPDFILYAWLERLGSVTGTVPDFVTGDFSVNIINIRLASQFFLHLSLSLWMGLVAAFPGLLYFLWGFVEPALLPAEKRGARRAFLLGTSMFYVGVAVGYFLVFPLTLRFLAGYELSPEIVNTLSLDSYMDNFLTLILVMGLVFELPLVAWLLGKAGIVSRSFFSSYRRHAIVALLILAAVITPSGDPFTLMVVFLPIYVLWEGSALLVPSSRTSKLIVSA